ncbi:ABC transporter ATP-binding protein [Paracoccus sp. ME4]|uniref:ABC transporter ATP-binding protein n=1 Tax=Paracoccus sp. ME4 TaxID=3138066 RepID=UPI00398AA922
MIELQGVSRTNRDGLRRTEILDNASVCFPTGRSVALLGANGAGKTTVLRMISGALRPDAGRISITGSVSWPIGFASGFHPDMTGSQNVRFIARINGVDPAALSDFVTGFAGLGKAYRQAYRTYSSGMRSRISLATSMGIGFDTYLIDEVSSVGDASFRALADATLRDRLQGAGAVIVSHSMGLVKELCRSGAVLHRGKITWHEDVADAIAHHAETMGRAAAA